MHHYPVLLPAVLEYLRIDPAGSYVDCTVGQGGYSQAIVERLTSGRLLAIDRDPDAIEATRHRLQASGGKVTFVEACYSEIAPLVRSTTPVFVPASGIVADLGLSRDQFEDQQRGFSFQREGPLDMRIDRRQALTAADIVNHYSEKDLADLIFQFGEERRSRRIARAIVRGRPLRNTTHLAEIVERAVPRTFRRRIHPATKTFQALRIAVNNELECLERFLEQAPLALGPGGRLVVVSFHSLEDRLVKLAFRRWAQREVLRIITKRVVRPTQEEIEENPASRSAKLRAAERTSTPWRQQN